jgi:hypothetical protein
MKDTLWRNRGFRPWSELTDIERAQAKRTPELAGGTEEEYGVFYWIRGSNGKWFFVDLKLAQLLNANRGT